jgi:nicotinate-nucleotide adenylyltransferase
LKRIGVFGGAFDPPHNAHLALAQTAIDQLQLDELKVIPTGYAWHKDRPLSAAEHRLKMTQLAFSGIDRVSVDAREIKREGHSYTIDTLEALQADDPDAVFFLLIGGDQLAAFNQWHRWQDILSRATVCVAERPLQASAPANVLTQTPALRQSIHLQLPPMTVSATAIRQLIASHPGPLNTSQPDLAGLVPDAVARYISLHGLYQARPTSS